MPPTKTPVVFIHGLWLHSSSWQNWVELFQAAGHPTYTPEWPGVASTVEETRAHPEAQAGKGLAEIIAVHADFLKSLDTKPIIIGHSFGGLIVQRLLGDDLAAAGVAIDPAQIKGVLPLPIAQLRSALPGLGNPLNYKKSVALTAKQFRYGFANAVSETESQQLFDAWTIPSPGRPLFEGAMANFNPHSPAKVDTHNNKRGPLLIVSGRQDHTVPDVVSRAAYKLYRHSTAVTELKQFDRGHSLTVDSGWREIAEASLNWLDSKGFGTPERIDLDAGASASADAGSEQPAADQPTEGS
jgi:non-heme chloroperoxidase